MTNKIYSSKGRGNHERCLNILWLTTIKFSNDKSFPLDR